MLAVSINAQGQEDLVHLIYSASDEEGRRSDGVMESEEDFPPLNRFSAFVSNTGDDDAVDRKSVV